MNKYLQPDGKITFFRVDKKGSALQKKMKKIGDKKENKSERKGPIRL